MTSVELMLGGDYTITAFAPPAPIYLFEVGIVGTKGDWSSTASILNTDENSFLSLLLSCASFALFAVTLPMWSSYVFGHTEELGSLSSLKCDSINLSIHLVRSSDLISCHQEWHTLG